MERRHMPGSDTDTPNGPYVPLPEEETDGPSCGLRRVPDENRPGGDAAENSG